MVEGSALSLSVNATNRSQDDYRGVFGLNPAGGNLQVWVREHGGEWQRLDYLAPGEAGCDYAVPTLDLPAGKGLRWGLVIGFDPIRERRIFGNIGRYEVRARYVEPLEGMSVTMPESEPVAIDVRHSGAAAEALGAYTRGIALVAQFGFGPGPDASDAAGEQAYAFVTEFRESPYADQVRRGLVRLLESKIADGRGTEQDSNRLHELWRLIPSAAPQ
jgi:hypothetical protein